MSINNQSNANVQILDQLILVSLDGTSITTGRRKLKKEDLGVGADLPPDVMVSLGSKKIIDPQLINPFDRFKNKAITACLKVGIRFMGGYAIPTDKVNELVSELNILKHEFYGYKQEFLKADFNGWINSFEEKYRAILLREAAIDLEYLDRQIQFGFSVLHITPFGNSIVNENLIGQVKSMSDEIFEEVAGTVEKYLKNVNSDAISQHTLNPIRAIANKLQTLAFIDSTVEGLHKYITDVLSGVPKTGKIRDKHYNDVLSLLNNLRNPKSAKSFVELLSNPQAASGLDSSLVIADSFELPSTDLVSPPAQPALDSTPTAPADVVPHTNAFVVAETIDDNFLSELPTDLPPAGPVADPVTSDVDSSAPVEVTPPVCDVEVVDDSALLGSFDVPATSAVDLNAPASATFAEVDSDDDGIMLF
ncbi:DUF3150 domain-containing protein [Providencia sp. PROV255]|uniref:DUF3150 domain-containing protein n=1 Tax=Providencia sp. PROV255 TaxID=2949943 RepID=UPI00234B30D2|nr:DUF3150 domain-containing protein [Providencia sp. PROV255]